MAHRKNLQSRLAKLTNFYQSLGKDADADTESGSEAGWEPGFSGREAVAVPRSSVSIVRNRRSYAEPSSPPPEQEFPSESGADLELYGSTLQVGEAVRGSGDDMDTSPSPQPSSNATATAGGGGGGGGGSGNDSDGGTRRKPSTTARAPRSPQDPRGPRSPQSPGSGPEKTFGQFRSSAFIDKAGRGGTRKPTVNLFNPPAKVARSAASIEAAKQARNDTEEEHKTEKTIRLVRPQKDRPSPLKSTETGRQAVMTGVGPSRARGGEEPMEGVEDAGGEPRAPGAASRMKEAPMEGPETGPRGGSVSYATYQGAAKLKKRPRPNSKLFDDNGAESASASEANNSEEASQSDAARSANGAERSKVLRKTPGRLPRGNGKEDGEAVRSLKAKATLAASEQGTAGQAADGQGQGNHPKEVVIEETEIVTIEEIVTPKDKVGPGSSTIFDNENSQSVKTQISQHTNTKKTVVVQGNRISQVTSSKGSSPPSSPKEKDSDAVSGVGKVRINTRDRRSNPFTGSDINSRASPKATEEASQRSPVISRKMPTSKPAEAKPIYKQDKVLSGDSETKPEGGLNSTREKACNMPEESADQKAAPGVAESDATEGATQTPASGGRQLTSRGDDMGASLPIQGGAKNGGEDPASDPAAPEGEGNVAGVLRKQDNQAELRAPDRERVGKSPAVPPGPESSVKKPRMVEEGVSYAAAAAAAAATTTASGSDTPRLGVPVNVNKNVDRSSAANQLRDGETPEVVAAVAAGDVCAVAAEKETKMDVIIVKDLCSITGSGTEVISSILDINKVVTVEQTQSLLKASAAAEPSQDINSVKVDTPTKATLTGEPAAQSMPLLSDTSSSRSGTHAKVQGEPSRQHVEAGPMDAEQAASASLGNPSLGVEEKAPQPLQPPDMVSAESSTFIKAGTQFENITDGQQQQQQQQLQQQQQPQQQQQQQQQPVINAATAEHVEVSAGNCALPDGGGAGEAPADGALSVLQSADDAAVPIELPGFRCYLPRPSPMEMCAEVEVIENMFQEGTAAPDTADNGGRPSRQNPAFEQFSLLSPIKEEDLEEEGGDEESAGAARRQKYFPPGDVALASKSPKLSPLASGFGESTGAPGVAEEDGGGGRTSERPQPPDDQQNVNLWSLKSGTKSELPSVDFQKTKTMNFLKEQIKNRSLKSMVGHQSLHNGFGKDRAGQLNEDAEGKGESGAPGPSPHNKFSNLYKQSSLLLKGFDASGLEPRSPVQTSEPADVWPSPRLPGTRAAHEGADTRVTSPRGAFAPGASALSQLGDFGTAGKDGGGVPTLPPPLSGHASAAVQSFEGSRQQQQQQLGSHGAALELASPLRDMTSAAALGRKGSGGSNLLQEALPGPEQLLAFGSFPDQPQPGMFPQGPTNGAPQDPAMEGERQVNPRPGKMVIFYEPGFTGKKIELFTDVADATSWDLPATISLRVVRGGWLVYRESGFTGECFALEEGEEEMTDPWGEMLAEEQGFVGGPMVGRIDQGKAEEDGEPKEPKIVIGSIKRVVKDHSMPEIVLFSEEEFRGTDIIVCDDAEKVEVYGMQPTVSSIIVNSGVWLLYLGFHYMELISILEPGEYPTMDCWDGMQPRIGSLRPLKMGEIKVERPNEAKVILYEEPNFEGQQKEAFLEIPTLGGVFGEDSPGRVASIRVRAGVWVGYEGPNFSGRQYILEEGEYHSWQEWGGCNETLSSIRPIFADFAEPRVVLLELPGSPEGRELSVEGDSLTDVEAVGYAPTTTSISVERGVWVAFELEDFMGQMFVLEKGYYATPADWGGQGPTLSSIRPVRLERSVEMSSKAKMEVYSQRDFSGMHRLADADFKTLPEGWSTVGSARVLKGCWVLYSNDDFSGREFILEEGCYSCPEAFFSLDAQIKSLRPIPIVFSEPSISLFSHEDLRGREMVLEEATPSLDTLGGGGCVRSLHVHGGLWVAFEFPNFQGRQLLLEPSETPDWKQRSSWGRLGSIRPLKQSGVCVRVRNQGQDGVLTVKGDLADPRGVSVCLLPDCGKSTQLWLFQDGFLRSLASEACLEVVGGMAREGTRVVLWPEHGKPQQRWYIDSDGTIGSRLRDDLVLDVQGSGIIDRNQAVIMLRNQHRRSQLWQLEVQ
ncbi:uncharacterized protein LOC116953008 isoform X2 [Petromyzon marinus]|uniref:Uncharacterized protein LOC116953008 isoform X2 n=1 Tax=Petromyzon marinus TaxID=7757 RepID=A0AAJ7XBK6_PETMA|nr:uncharacterized protein LOC116953008 isoform X2 [Petromyzon marinus]